MEVFAPYSFTHEEPERMHGNGVLERDPHPMNRPPLRGFVPPALRSNPVGWLEGTGTKREAPEWKGWGAAEEGSGTPDCNGIQSGQN